ncbi:hypothetical protein [Jeotgalibaca sp. A127]|uniref:hypothetical protein n=1 Tax=Jeotgalibaca sp. A127 TaxID=3457324 RepID=UPI003FD1DC0E
MNAGKIQALGHKALALHESGKFESAEKLFLEALYLLDEKENELYQMIVYGLGINYAKQGNYEGAKGCFEEGRLNAQKANNIPHELEMHHQLVVITRESADFEAAEVLSEEEIRFRKKQAPDDFEGLAAAYYEAARIYKLSGKNSHFEKAIKEAHFYAEKTRRG